MKITFDNASLVDTCREMEQFLLTVKWEERKAPKQAAPPETPKPTIEALKPTAAERMAKARAAKGKKKPPANGPDPRAQYDRQLKEDLDARPIEAEPAPPAFEDIVLEQPKPEPEVNLVTLRIKTTEELQKAYAEGKHTQVLALLSQFGNGAKSFRELRIEDFIPLRAAIDAGALA